MIDNLKNIPKEMKEEAFFCLWGKDEEGKKLPLLRSYNKIFYARTNEIKTFRNFNTIIYDLKETQGKIFEVGKDIKKEVEIKSIGLGIFNSFCGIDIDHCINESGEINDLAKDVIQTINSYTEKSPSGTGVHIYFKVESEVVFDKEKYYIKNSNNGLEVYLPKMTKRFLTITGNYIQGEFKTIDLKTLQNILNKYMKRKEQSYLKSNIINYSEGNFQDDNKYLQIGLEKGKKLIDLWNSFPSGSGGNESETDLALCQQLAYWTNNNRELIRNAFELSPYYQRKDEVHKKKWHRPDYSEQTIQKAINSTKETARISNQKYILERVNNEIKTTNTNQIEKSLNDIKKVNEEFKNFSSKYNVMSKVDSFFETIDSGIFKPISTGYKQLDSKLNGGLSMQSIVILGGGTSVGKTTFTINLVLNLVKDRPVLYLTLEMSEEQIMSKIFSNLAYMGGKMSISNTNILQSYNKNKMTEYQRQHLIEEIKKHDYLNNLFVKFPNSANFDDLKKEIDLITEELKSEGKSTPVIVIDYLQFIQGTPREDTQSLIKRIQRQLKKYAIKENSLVILLSANSREANNQKETRIDSGRDTSDIEYTSDYNLQLNFYEWEHKTNTNASRKDLIKINPRKMTLTIHKQRFGSQGEMIDFVFNGITNTFQELSEEETKTEKNLYVI